MFAKRGLLALVLCGSSFACDGEEGAEAVTPSVVLSGDTSSLTAGAVVSINGSYTSCLERSGDWSIRLTGNAPLDNDPLSVVLGDTSCQLKLTEIHADQKYETASPIALAGSYQGSASAFVPTAGGATSFYANAKLDTADFGGNFVVQLIHSANPSNLDGGAVSATYATVEASNQALIIPPPSYTISFTSGTPFTLQLDAAKKVTSASGVATLQDGMVLGTAYVVDATLGNNPSYAQVQGAWNTAALAGTVRNITGANPAIPASYFALPNVSLATPAVRTIIVGSLLNTVLSYQVIKVTFKSP